jgi:Asp-tRNA(Asn)/Glu-tRNA(Gln) amidotransferase A subunit family amidase
VALPCGADASGMPLGVQLVGRRWCDDALLALGLWAEAALPGAVRPW